MSDSYTATRSPAVDGFVLVPVPAERVIEVYSLLAQTKSQSAHSDRPSDSDWTERELVELATAVRSRPIAQVLVVLARQSDEWLSTDDLARETSLSKVGMRAALSGLARTVRSQIHRDDVPFEARSIRSDGQMRTHYRMSRATATSLLSAIDGTRRRGVFTSSKSRLS